MTGMFFEPAVSSWLDRAVPSMEAMTRMVAPLVIIWSIGWVWVGMSSLANWRSTSYPAASRPSFTALPSAIQRSEVWVGIATPTLTLPPFEAAAPLSELEAPPAPPPAHPLSARAPAAKVAATVAIFPKKPRVFMEYLLFIASTSLSMGVTSPHVRRVV